MIILTFYETHHKLLLQSEQIYKKKKKKKKKIGPHHANPVISKRRKRSRQENKIVIEYYILNKPNARGYRKCMLSLWLNKGIFWVFYLSLEIEELERNLAENDSY